LQKGYRYPLHQIIVHFFHFTSPLVIFSNSDTLIGYHGMQIREALILAVAAENHCRLLLSEDLHSGFTWRGLTVVDPFAPKSHPLLKGVLMSGVPPPLKGAIHVIFRVKTPT
jgi:hypothetical protein